MTDEITISAISNNSPGARPRAPLVHIMGVEHGGVTSICFHPSHAGKIANAILNAAKAATDGRKLKRVKFDFSDDNKSL